MTDYICVLGFSKIILDTTPSIYCIETRYNILKELLMFKLWCILFKSHIYLKILFPPLSTLFKKFSSQLGNLLTHQGAQTTMGMWRAGRLRIII